MNPAHTRIHTVQQLFSTQVHFTDETDQVNFSHGAAQWENHFWVSHYRIHYFKGPNYCTPTHSVKDRIFLESHYIGLLEFDPEPVIKKGLKVAAFFWRHDGATIHLPRLLLSNWYGTWSFHHCSNIRENLCYVQLAHL